MFIASQTYSPDARNFDPQGTFAQSFVDAAWDAEYFNLVIWFGC